MPVGPGEGDTLIIEGIIDKRPDFPNYIEFEREPDRIIIVDRPDVAGYILGINRGAVYQPGVKLIYRCYNNYKPGKINSWKIELLIQSPVSSDGFMQMETKVVYPWGCSGYNFNPDHVRHYVYGFKF